MKPPKHHWKKPDAGETRGRPNPVGRVLLIVLLAGLVWLVGKGVLALWRMLAAGP